MDSLQNHEAAFNLAFYKRFCFYQIFDPNTPKMFGYNIYKVNHAVIMVTVLCSIVYITSGFFMEKVDKIGNIELLMIVFFFLNMVLALIKMTIFFQKPEEVWSLMNIARVDFLTSRLCRKNMNILKDFRDKSIRITNMLNWFAIFAYTVWLMIPLILKMSITLDPNQRTQSIFNLPFPVKTDTFNNYYWLFYTWELFLGYFILYYTTILDTFVMSLCWVIMGQYDVLTAAFSNVGDDENHKIGKVIPIKKYKRTRTKCVCCSIKYNYIQI